MLLINLIIHLTCLSICSSANSSVDVHVVYISSFTSTNHKDIQNTLLLFRSIRLFGNALTNVSLHACYDTGDIHRNEFDAIGASLLEFDYSSDCWNHSKCRNLFCASQVAHELYKRQLYNILVVYVSNSFYVSGDITTPLNYRKSIGQHIGCMPSFGADASLGGCEMDFFFLHSSLGTPVHMYLKFANRDYNATPALLLQHAASLFSSSIHFIRNDISVVRSSAIYYHDVSLIPQLIEFDGRHHQISISQSARPGLNGGANSDCHIHLCINFPQLNTVDVITHLLQPVFESDNVVRLLGGCDSFSELAVDFINPLDTNFFIVKRRVYDTFLFNDELSLLGLRLQVLENVVDYHFVVECNVTFTGQPKPLYFMENANLFEAYASKIVHVVIPGMPYPQPTKQHEVWENEFFSRNYVMTVLDSLSAVTDSDIVLAADVDEIPNPDIFVDLHAIYNHENSPEARRPYKLHLDNFIYNFRCYVGERIQNSLSASTISVAKQIATSAGSNNAMLSMRYYRQYEDSAPHETVLFPGGWHMSFFLSIDRIIRKLESYSHQNFRPLYEVSFTSEERSCSEDICDVENSNDQVKQLSREKIRSRVAAGEHIGNKDHYRKCRERPSRTDPKWLEKSRHLQRLWETVYASSDDTILD